jgi:electron transfer flavoprotein beta subunit
MRILVALKQVPARDSLLKLDSSARWIDESDLTYETNEPDAYALEAALQLREQQGGEAVILCAGPERAQSSIREALAKGADRAIHIEVDGRDWDALSTARLLAAAAKSEQPDLILTGLQSDDLGAGQTGVLMAEILNVPHATIIMHAEVKGAELRAKRELENGWFQHVTMPLPALLTIQSGISRLRYATLMGIKKAKTKEVKKISAADLGIAPQPSHRLTRVFFPEKSKQTVMLAGSAAEQAAQLVEKLKFEVRAI